MCCGIIMVLICISLMCAWWALLHVCLAIHVFSVWNVLKSWLFLKNVFQLFISFYSYFHSLGLKYCALGPLHWEHGILATGPPGKSLAYMWLACSAFDHWIMGVLYIFWVQVLYQISVIFFPRLWLNYSFSTLWYIGYFNKIKSNLSICFLLWLIFSALRNIC